MEQALCHPHASHPAATTPPDVLRFFQIDSAVSRLLWIDIHDVGCCPFACEKDCLAEKSRDTALFSAEQSVLRGPVCLGIIANNGHVSRISGQHDAQLLRSQD
jgi:hypothetical protein